MKRGGGADAGADAGADMGADMGADAGADDGERAWIAHVAALDAELARVAAPRIAPRRGRHTPRCYREVAETIEPTTRRG